MPSSTDNEAMPHPTLTKILGKPTQRTLAILRAQVLANTRAIHSDRGDGRLGHAYIVLGNVAYQEASHNNVAFILPVKPVPPVHALNATQDTMYRSDKTYDCQLAEWKRYNETEATILQQILSAVDDTYTKALKDRLWGYGNSTPISIMHHLMTTYGKHHDDAGCVVLRQAR